MSGCTDWQLLTKVLIPTARRDILIGVNQVIMQCLAMVVLASLIGAKGLGIDLLIALNRLRIGVAIEIGVCIVLIAIVLDRLSLAWANKQTDYFADLTFTQRNKYPLMFGAVFVIGIIFAYIGKFIFPEGFNYLYLVPHGKGISTAQFWQDGVDWIWDTFFYSLKGFNEWLILEVLMPVKASYLGMPVAATFTLVMGVGFIVGGIRTALTVGGFLLFIALTEWWDRALITAYLMSVSVIISGFTGIRYRYTVRPTPSIYALHFDLLRYFSDFPIVYLFNSSHDVIWCYRYVCAHCHCSVCHDPSTKVHSSRFTQRTRVLTRCWHDVRVVSRLQRWLSIELPMSFPHIALGINQTVVFALSMVIIGAMIGTDDLGQLILGSLSDRNGVGDGLILGICVACIGLAIDQILRTWANQRKQALGLN